MPFMFLCAVIAFALQANPQRPAMTGGGQITMSRDGESLRIAIIGPRPGLAHLCIAEDSRVRILHASAALGEAVYARDGEDWRLASGFEFKLRDRRGTPPAESEKTAFFSGMGWLANADNSGKAPREFSVRLTSAIRAVAATFLATDEPPAISHWPTSVTDDCVATKMAQGFLPPRARFKPADWQRLQ